MQRSDISNINKLFLESTSEFHETHCKGDFVGGTFIGVDRIQLSDPVSSTSIRGAAYKVIDDAINYYERSRIMSSDMWVTHDYIVVVERYAGRRNLSLDEFTIISNHYIRSVDEVHRICKKVCIPSNMCKVSEFLDKFKYTDTATKGIDPDLGFGDLFDVL